MKNSETQSLSKNQDRLIDAKISLLQLAKELGNIQKACRAAGIARSSFYEIKKAYEQFGRNGLVSTRGGRKEEPVTIQQEEIVLKYTRLYPSYSYQRLCQRMQIEGQGIGESVIRRVWKKHDLLKRIDRYLWLDQEAMQGRGTLTEQALKAVQRLKDLDEASAAHIDVKSPGELISQDLYEVGRIKGVGRIYMQSAVDCFTSLGFARLCVSKKPLHSVALVHEQIIPFFDKENIQVKSILTDRGREYCGRQDGHLFELYLGAQNIEHRLTKVASPWTNGFVERFHRTLKEEFFSLAFREKWYENIDELQTDLDNFLDEYNNKRPHQGYRPKGRTPIQTFKDWSKEPNKKPVAS